MTAPASTSRLGNYFARTLPPVDGRLRFLVVGLLLVLAQDTVFGSMPRRIATCPEGFYEADGIMRLIGPSKLADVARWIDGLQAPLFLAWCAAALGLLGRWSLLLTGIGVLLTQGWYRGCVGTGHAWYLPTYTLLALGLTGGTDRFSLDAVLARKYPRYPFRPSAPDSVGATGLARSLVLLASVFVMTSAGLSKLLEAGPGWMDGESLQLYLRANPMAKPWGKWLWDILVENQTLASLLSVFTFIIELGAPAILFFKRLRFPYVLAAWGFHMGIMALMVPRYLPQMTCYLLIVDWGALFGLRHHPYGAQFYVEQERAREKAKEKEQARRRALRAGGSSVESETPPQRKKKRKKAPLLSSRTLGICAAAGLTFSAVLIATGVIRREYYPLSHIPMYSSRLTEDSRGGFALSEWRDAAGFQRICRDYLEDHRPEMFLEHVARRTVIFMRSERGLRAITGPLTSKLIPGERTVWMSRSALSVARDVAAVQNLEALKASSGRHKTIYDLTRGAQHSKRLLELTLPAARDAKLGKRADSLELVYSDGDFLFILARAEL